MPQVVEPEPRQARFLRQRPPSRPPAFHVSRRVKAGDVIIHHSLAVEGELGNKGSKDIVRRFNRAKALCSSAQPCNSGDRYVRERDYPPPAAVLDVRIVRVRVNRSPRVCRRSALSVSFPMPAELMAEIIAITVWASECWRFHDIGTDLRRHIATCFELHREYPFHADHKRSPHR